MRILTFTSLFPNRIDPEHGIFIYQRAVHLIRGNRNSVEVVAPVPFFPKWVPSTRWRTASQTPAVEDVGPLRVHHPRYFLLPRVSMPLHGALMYWGSLPLVRQLHASAKFECIDSHFIYPDGFAAILLGKSLGIPVMVSARGTDMNSYPSFHLIRPMIRWTLRNAAIRIAVSSALKEKMADVGGADLSIHVITNGVHPGLFHPVPRKEARRRLGLPDAGPLIIAIGSLIEQKGHHTLIRAVRKIVPHYPTVRLYILGHGPYRSTLERLIQTLELEANVYLVGKRPNDELMFWFSAADVSCLASMREGWPNVISESLACGTAVVATRVGGIPEILHSPDLGIIVEQSVESIAAGLLQALSRNWDRELIARKACGRTWETVAAEIEEILHASIAASSLGKKVI